MPTDKTYGYCGRILHVDLSAGNITVETPPDAFYRKYMGGSAMNLTYLLKEMPAHADPLGPENILALGVGVTTGVAISGQSRVTATAKSPLTGAIGDSQSGGFWPAQLKFAGFDALVIRGKSPRPVYLWIKDGRAEIRPADHLWGHETGEVQQRIRRELDDSKIEVLQIGPAGERRVRFAALVSMCNRANGRTGMGAVMGSKNLKAVAVRGSRRPDMADAKTVKALARQGAETFPDSMIAGMGKYGTAGVVAAQQHAGGLPSFNYGSGVFSGWDKIDGTALLASLLKARDTCFGCVVRCKRVVEKTDGPYRLDPLYGGPEYETIATFGSYCGVDDLAAISRANELCNRHGMDTISCGATIAWAMECFENGVLTSEDVGGLTLKFGHAETMVCLVEMIAARQGFGDILAEGSARAARWLKRGARFLITGKDQEAPAHMPQVKRSLALAYAANSFGADHMSSCHDPDYENDYQHYRERLEYLGLGNPQPTASLGPEKVRFFRKTQQLYGLTDSLCLCQFVHGATWQLYGPREIITLVSAVTGWNVTVEELLAVGERRINMMRAFNAQEGFGRREDCLPDRFFDQPLAGGPSDGHKLDRQQFESALEEYYRQCGWDSDGRPTRSTLKRLGLTWVADLK